MKTAPAYMLAFLMTGMSFSGGVYLGMQTKEKERDTEIQKTEVPSPLDSDRWCPVRLYSRVRIRSMYREADKNEAALICFYALPGSVRRETLDLPLLPRAPPGTQSPR
jgi:hypothetical protein